MKKIIILALLFVNPAWAQSYNPEADIIRNGLQHQQQEIQDDRDILQKSTVEYGVNEQNEQMQPRLDTQQQQIDNQQILIDHPFVPY